MTRRLSMTGVLSLLLVTGGCGKDEPKVPAGKAPPVAKTSEKPKKKEKPPAPEGATAGYVRLVNLLIDDQGKTKKVDLWATRSFKWAPKLLAEGVEMGQVSAWAGVPKGQSIKVMEHGAGPDADALGGIFNPSKGQHITGVLTRSRGRSSVSMWYEKSDSEHDNVPKAPAGGKAVIRLAAGQLWHLPEEVKNQLGYAFRVSDGTGAGQCRPQRGQAEGKPGALLGGTVSVDYEVDPGKVVMALHDRTDKECTGETKLQIELDVKAGDVVLGIVYTPDLKKLASLVTPMRLK